ncbi:MAG: TfoX/Sxy family protein [Betaproteobacteria bacterium]
MANTPDFIEHVLELMRPAGRASARAMFGGHGLYLDGLIVAIVVEDVLYLKTDDETRPAYLERSLDPFSYTTKEGKAYAMSYHRAPEEAVEGPDEMRAWLRPALGAALRNAQKKPRTAALRRARGRPA